METNTVVANWDAASLLETLRAFGACAEALAWLGDEDAAESTGCAVGLPRSLAEVFEQLHRADWWLWLAARARVDRRLVVLAACACARTALKHVPSGEPRPLQAIELAERWARGEPDVTRNRVREVARAAWRAAYAAADAAAAAAYAAADAAAADAAAAYAAAAAGYDGRAKALASMMPLVREHLPLDVVALALAHSRPPAEVASTP